MKFKKLGSTDLNVSLICLGTMTCVEQKTQEEGSIPRRLVAKACIEALKTKDSMEKIIEITSSEENPKTNMSKAIKTFSI